MKHIGKKIFVTGIDTGVGKTVVSAVLVRALSASYWKPVQCGDAGATDAITVGKLAGISKDRLLPERFLLSPPVSPHKAAELEGVVVRLEDFSLPEYKGDLIVEGAGGVLAPLNQSDSVVDIAARLGLSVILVSRHYLGSLNHTLLSAESLRSRGLALNGLVFSGAPNEEYERFLSRKTGLPVLFRVPDMGSDISCEHIRQLAEQVRLPETENAGHAGVGYGNKPFG